VCKENLEINAADINLRTPKWAKWVQGSILPLCGEKLGVPLASRLFIKAELYKLLSYEEGAHFKPHRDSERHPECLQRLRCVCLPNLKEVSSCWSSAMSDFLGTAPSHLSLMYLWLHGNSNSYASILLRLRAYALTSIGTLT
jgi:hypothetical protein